MKKILSSIVYAISIILGCTTVYATLNFAFGQNLFDAILYIGDDAEKSISEDDDISDTDDEVTEIIETSENNKQENNSEIQDIEYIDYKEKGNLFELPITGATGYTVVTTQLLMKLETEDERIEREKKEEAETLAKSREESGLDPLPEVETIVQLEVQTTDIIELESEPEEIPEPIDIVAGESFTIMTESGDWWLICKDEVFGWIEHKNCMINLPDVIPSIIYDNTNSYNSIFTSLEENLPGVTNEILYDTKSYNPRLDEKTYAMPVMYETAKKIADVQATALKDKNTLILVESYRPNDVQQRIAGGLTQLMKDNSDINEAVSSWGESWFAPTGVTSHQKGIAVDVSLAKVKATETRYTGDYQYTKIIEFEEHKMPTTIHDLSPNSATKSKPVSYTTSTWSKTGSAKTMTDSATTLQRYFINVGMSPSSSKWWQFEDFKTFVNSDSLGQYILSGISSVVPTSEPSDSKEEQEKLSELVDLTSNYIVE